MRQIFERIDEYQIPNIEEISRLIMQNPTLSVAVLAGILLISIGCYISLYKYRNPKNHSYSFVSTSHIKTSNSIRHLNFLLDRLFSIKPVCFIKKEMKENLKLYYITDDAGLNRMSNMLTALISVFSLILAITFKDIGQLWYVRALIIVLCAILPYYAVGLVFDVLKQRMNRNIPCLIDEFRIAFTEKKRIKPALHECSKHIDGKLGGVITRLADSTFIEEGLVKLKDSLDNLWFNTFAALICNYKSNGGDLSAQLYKLNRTMLRYISMQKKKDLRLIWYEVFVICAAIFSIPAISFLNGILLGNTAVGVSDVSSNVIMARVAAYCIFALITIRLLRKL